MRALAVALVGGCSFSSPLVGGDGGVTPDGSDAIMIDGGGCWGYVPTNFDSCLLAPNPVALDVGTPTTISDSTSLPHRIITQGDGSELMVIHLTALTVNNVLTVDGTRPIVLAVDGATIVNALIDVRAGADDGDRCARGVTGGGGTGSGNPNGGGGGGGGGGGADVGGDGGDGIGNQNGTKGGGGKSTTGVGALSPMRAGCGGGSGGQHNGSGTPGTGGGGGGGLQISVNGALTLNSAGAVNASGFGGGAASSQTGGGGGGGGGAVFLEASHVAINAGAVVCADGGSGSEGGGNGTTGAPGTRSPCVGTIGATTPNTSVGGNGGGGGFGTTATGGLGLVGESNNAGGGAGGGGVGWIRIRSVSAPTMSGVVTPTALVD